MNENKTNVKELCEQTISLLKELKDVAGDHDWHIKRTIEYAKRIIVKENLKEKYGVEINIRYINGEENVLIDGWDEYGLIFIKRYKNGDVLNSKEQPDNELLFAFKFHTGAYIFGENYYHDLFNEFFEELKSYKPKYKDELNDSLYFEMENGSKLFNEYDVICKKYQEKYYQLKKEEEVKELKMKLKELEEKMLKNKR